MFGLKKSPLHRTVNNHLANPGSGGYTSSNPFDSDNESDNKQAIKPARRTSSEPSLITPHLNTNPFDDDDIKGTHSSTYFATSTERNRYKNDFGDSGGFENQTAQELENYAVHKAAETTKTVNSCLRIAEDIRQDATKTLITLHQQGEQIRKTHQTAADTEHDLSKGEKLLGSLGGLFSKTWRPKKIRSITGPVITRDDPVQRRGNHLEQREKLVLSSARKDRSSSGTPPPEPTNALQKVEVEHAKQDDALSDLSNLLGELKNMAVDMGSEIERQNKSLDHFQDDVDELNFRIKGANRRGRRLLGK
ncbi:SNAP25 protein snap33 [Datura stramonium]|uniref:SNAP25 protein snap33 n=1 Tax=Datura stramonium TaxID=4076 RepID=A0ABS8SHA9_DATST|nr:SNAP25 protein snap33 [Datura stramonium]